MLKVDSRRHKLFEDEYAEAALKVMEGLKFSQTEHEGKLDKVHILQEFYKRVRNNDLCEVMELGRLEDEESYEALSDFVKRFMLAPPESIHAAHVCLKEHISLTGNDSLYRDDSFLKYFQKNAYDTLRAKKDTSGITYNKRILRSLGMKVCPYCGCTNIGRRGDHILGAELDHFVSKSKYPFFALSLYNLVPSCKSCNNHKNEDKGENLLSPLEEKADFDSNIGIRLYSRPYIRVQDNKYHESYMNVKVLADWESDDFERYEENIEAFALRECYDMLEPEAREYVDRMVRYPKTQLKELGHILAMDVDGVAGWRTRIEYRHRLEKDLFLNQCAEAGKQVEKQNSKMYTDLYRTYRRPKDSIQRQEL